MKQDIKVVVDPKTGARDIAIGTDGDLDFVDDFSSSVDLSVLTNKRASGVEVPDPLQRRGWVGDITPRTQGFMVGSKIWLFEQARLTQSVINDIRDATQESLQWIVDSGKAERVEVTAEAIGTTGVRLQASIFIGNNVVRRYFTLWNNTEERFI